MISYLGVIRTVMIADTAQFNRGIHGASLQMKRVAKGMRQDAEAMVGVGAALNVAITMPVLMATRAVVQLGTQYEDTMMKVRHVTGLSMKDFTSFEKQQRKIRQGIGSDPIKFSEIAYRGAQAQLKPNEINKYSEAVAKAMRILPKESSLEAIADGFINVITAFNVPSSGYKKTMAEMIGTIDLAIMSWEDYTSTIKQVAALSASLKTQDAFKKLNLAMAMATGGGVRGSQVATATRNLYRRIYTEGGQENSVMNQAAGILGYTNKQGKGSVVKMFESKEGADADLFKFAQMITAGGTFASPKFASDLDVMAREFTTFLKLASADPKKMEEFNAKYLKVQNDMERRFNDAQKLLSTKIEKMSSAWKDMLIQFSKSQAMGMLGSLFDGITVFLTKLSNLPDSAKSAIILGGWAASIGSIIFFFRGLIDTLTLARRIKKLIPASGTLAQVLGGGGIGGIGGASAVTNIKSGTVTVIAKVANVIGTGAVGGVRAPKGKTASAVGPFSRYNPYARWNTPVSPLMLPGGSGMPQMRGYMLPGGTPNMKSRGAGGRFISKQTIHPGYVPNWIHTPQTNRGEQFVAEGARVGSPYAKKFRMGSSLGTADAAIAAGSTSGMSVMGPIGRGFKGLGSIIGKILPVIGKFALIGSALYVVFKGLYDFIAALVIPAIQQFGKAIGIDIKWETINEMVKMFVEGLNAIAKGVSIALAVVTGVIQSVFETILQSVMWLYYKATKNAIGAEDASTRLAGIFKGDIIKEKLEQLDAYYNKQTSPASPEMKNIESDKKSADIDFVAMLKEQVGGSAGFYEAGTAAGYEAVTQGQNALVETINKMKTEFIEELQELQRLEKEKIRLAEEEKTAREADA